MMMKRLISTSTCICSSSSSSGQGDTEHDLYKQLFLILAFRSSASAMGSTAVTPPYLLCIVLFLNQGVNILRYLK